MALHRTQKYYGSREFMTNMKDGVTKYYVAYLFGGNLPSATMLDVYFNREYS